MRRFCSLLALAVVALAGCSARLDPPEQRGELVVAVRDTPGYYQEEDGSRSSGFEHDLVKLFGRELGVKTRFVVTRDHAELLQLLRRGKVHFAAVAVPSAASDAADDLRYTSPLREADQLLVQRADSIPLDDPGELVGKTIEVLAGSPQEAALSAMNGGRPPFKLAALTGITEVDLLERVSRHESKLAATDASHFAIAQNYFPNLQVAQKLPGSVSFAWAFGRDADPALFQRAQAFIERVRRDGTLARINDRYFGHIRRINRIGISDFLERIATLLPHYQRDFQAAQEVTGIDWRLLAALAYQESGWDPLATSFTGVRGMMMLTDDTADRMHVDNRLDPKQSIAAGAKYLAELIDELPAKVKQPDRTWLALAAYNLGQGHMNGARAIAVGLKRDPDSWYEMKKVLPLMARQKYYERLKSGRARGGEAVIMVENVRSFYDILTRYEPPYQPGAYAAPMEAIPPM
ncbi:MAG TPA: membrane-bound lytic murein transglycosylase MltF [Rhodocyclaceae bacterium]|nr:membrane-bound lytic murein transglycosylase MltF [Rhodocyclaceae bacterium]